MEFLKDQLLEWGFTAQTAAPVLLASGIVIIAALAFLANFIAKAGLIRLINAAIARSRWPLLLLLRKHQVFHKFSHIAPAIVIQLLTPVFLADWPILVDIARVAVEVYLIGVALVVIDAALNVALDAYNSGQRTRPLPIKGFIQAIKLTTILIGIILILAVILGKSPLILMSGLGALGAVLLLVFKDAILGFVAGIQLSANNMVQTGDWIEMPQQNADGFVTDVSLTTVKVQNWDKTITTIPSYLLISDSFKNWRGMFESGGRRIKRPIYIDMCTIRFLDEELLERCKKINLLRPYLVRVLKEIQEHNSEAKLDVDDLLNGRHLTNIGTFRAYCIAYLRQHKQLNHEMILLVRQLAPTAHGLPLEIYTFTSDTSWVVHEGVQSDIFDHFLAILPHFGLRVFQQPSGSDITDLGASLRGNPDSESFLFPSGSSRGN
ncbi:MAG TPA: mechanosensitive ion channel domain-containing protein [Opitutales bacterium]|nr:mechanosensitive ion channel domain-containing protein [Opitutales bacterium]